LSVPVVETAHGKVSGLKRDGVHQFLGIPYGSGTSGPARYRPPEPPAPWSGVRLATEFGPTAPQAEMPPTTANQLADVLGRKAQPPMGEDCLVVNVWTAGLDGGRRPVMVWLHGGAFTALSGSTESPARLAARGDVVAVSINHRLNALGFLYLDELSPGRYEGSGVAGMLDIVAALRWVRDNISAFGGDPSNVTIFGCSGGGLKVSTLLAMPPAQGLFHRAIIQSGPYTQAVRPEVASEFADRMVGELGLSRATVGQMDDIPVPRVLAAQDKALSQMTTGSGGGWPLWTVGPVVGGPALPAHPFEPTASPVSAGVPLIVGHNKNEAILGVVALFPSDDEVTDDDVERMAAQLQGDRGRALVELYRRTRPSKSRIELIDALMATDAMWIDSVRIAERKGVAGTAPVFMYRFDYETDLLGGRLRSCHSLEVPFVFDDVGAVPLSGSRPDRFEVAKAMSEAWVAFAKHGDPNHPGMPTWPSYTASDRSAMVFDVKCRLEPDPTELRQGIDALGIGFNPVHDVLGDGRSLGAPRSKQ
jgi:para-nitrobenzyl esterase